jgi:hypothetical protein
LDLTIPAVQLSGATSNWAARLDELLRKVRKTKAEAEKDAKSALWKIELAARLRRETGAAVTWIARELFMGSPDAVRGYLSVRRRAEEKAEGESILALSSS